MGQRAEQKERGKEQGQGAGGQEREQETADGSAAVIKSILRCYRLPIALLPDFSYSDRKATIGSTLVARRAGIKHAIKATTIKRIETAVKVNASVGETP